MLIHLFLDAFNAYGTGWFEPFSHDRISFNAIFVADPLFSIIPGVAFIALLILRRDHPARKRWANLSLSAVCVYLSVSIINKFIVYQDVKEIAEKNDIKYNRYFTTPTPLNTLLWFVALETDSGYHVGHRSVFDTNEKMHFEYFARGEELLSSVEDLKPVEQLKRFSQGFYVVQQWSDTLVFSDLRFGQMIGWKDPKARFAFYYYLTHPEDNLLVIQRGRFANWDKNAAKRLINRMGGDED
jgi:inner membrane protein